MKPGFKPRVFCLHNVCLIIGVVISWTWAQTIERPDRVASDDENSYEAPVLRGGLGVVSDNEPPAQRRYPDRAYSNPNRNSDTSPKRNYNDPGSAFRETFTYEPFPPKDQKGYPINNQSSGYHYDKRITQSPIRNPTLRPTQKLVAQTTARDPFDDPNRYRIPQQQETREGVRFVNGQPYREPANIQDRYGNRYDPRFHSIPGTYDPENDPRFSDPRYQDPRNVPKYNNNRQSIPKDRYDSKYRYYERFPDRQTDRLRDPNYDPRYDPDDLPVPGVLGGWLPELQGECRPGCENLPRDVTISTNYGRVNGFYVYLYDGPRVPEFERPGVANVDKVKSTVTVFLGIPYAQPPTGEARLMPPRAHRGWQSYDAVDWAPVCPQPIRFVGATKNAPLMDEDCLYLNIFSPTVKSGQSQLFPVMFYIHGGEFSHGSGNEFPGQQLAAWGRVVVVTINYRLGALGFLSTGDQHAPGNYGLLDQAMALKWVSDNINSFQGDRERITVFGPGAGAASAGLLAVMPRTRDMVRRVIAISGSPVAEWAAINDKFRAMNTSLVFGERVGCTIDNSWKLVDCVRRGRSAAELTNIEFKPEIGTWPWAPVVQVNISMPEDEWNEEWVSDDFMALPDLVTELYQQEKYNPRLQYLTGVSRDDASYLLYNNKSLAPNYDVGWDFFDVMVRDHINQYNYTLNPEGIFNAIKYMYTYYPDPNNRSHIREEFINFWSDYYFRAPQDAIVKTLVDNRVDTFMYVQNTTVEALRLPWWRQITHNLEHFFLTGAPFMDPVFFPEGQQVSRNLWTEGDRNMSEFFIYAFSNFSWYGKPTPTHILGVHWDNTKKGEILHFLAVNTTENSTMLWNYRQRECAFWTEYLPSVIGYITPTYPPTTEFWWEPDSPLQKAFWSISSLCLFLIVLVVVCFLLWRNATRKLKDRYYDDGTASLRGYPPDFKGSGIGLDTVGKGSQIPHSETIHTDVGSLHHYPASNGSVLNSLPPQTPIIPIQPSFSNANMAGSNATTMRMNSTTVLQSGYPQNQPLPPTPKMYHHQSYQNMPSNNGMMLNTSDDSLPSAMSLQVPMSNPNGQMGAGMPRHHSQQQMPYMGQASPGVTRKYPIEDQPMGMPRGGAHLVPGRMNQSQSRPLSQSSLRKDMSSTAV
ncbi:neuroligin-like protein glit-1 [Tigriopus californicus]|uniref:neuroligin-like protein glit-1 n=1 Tax=Tigriopus californicus TaxID=6832 RepID=UPI0027D9EDA3|nr:neuroligin-like protein glit-1 [Tigriopus californicus]XP_059086238.1 neuroligin-like protein glit-1 [Tigriopus californicus]